MYPIFKGSMLMNMNIPKEILQAIELIQPLLQDKNVDWLVGGSTGLLLQGVPIAQPPRDLDIYVDASSASVLYDVLQMYATDELIKSQTDIYISMLSHFRIANVQIELVGGFEVRVELSHYCVEISDLLFDYRVSYETKGYFVGLMPLAHELVFNLLRQRPDRYRAIAEKMRSNPLHYFTPLNKIMERNTFAPDFINRMNELL
jgi:hypothetical protein